MMQLKAVKNVKNLTKCQIIVKYAKKHLRIAFVILNKKRNKKSVL